MEIPKLPSVLMLGTGEYTTGIVYGDNKFKSSSSDKKIGVVGLVLFDLRRRGKVGRLLMAGRNGKKFPAIREHFKNTIESRYKEMDTSFESYPNDDVSNDPKAYLKAMDTLSKGDMVIIFTPDDTHYEIAKEALSRGLNCLVTKPAVKLLSEHLELVEIAKKNDVICCIEVHKRWDPMYSDSSQKIKSKELGQGFSFFESYMAQPKFQLETFKDWAGKSSDISYYLNSHHVDFLCWSLHKMARPTVIYAMGSFGVANEEPYNMQDTEDSITLNTQFEPLDKNQRWKGVALFTAAWNTPKTDTHTQQRFFYVGTEGQVQVDQARRGYTCATDNSGYSSVNPLYMKYSTDGEGYFNGQHGYGYRSIEEFVDCSIILSKAEGSEQKKKILVEKIDLRLATLSTCTYQTAILQAGRLSLDSKKPVQIVYDENGVPVDLKPL
eukprot:TRINITY_DN2748_c0_g2_i1.p1 TRINITY_DN2748_c0_g2~~TRINITY_DN2748_c0_g2_i1.p1  ORF type:complete len:437 (-),score=129.89 TRINITY_DN2748_c0_g2_i1:35-1345(-)